jgi:hypothetical protein
MHVYEQAVWSYALSSVKCFIPIGASFGNQNSDRDDPASPEEGEVCLGARVNHVAHGELSRARI